MASLLHFLPLILLMTSSSSIAQTPPSPGYYPGSRISSIGFDQGYRNLWGPQHQRLDQGTLTIWLDSSSGSGYKSLQPYRSGYFGASIKLQPGYTAGVITSFYLSNNEDYPGNHDEIDIEFLGTTPGKPYTLQTNVYIKGSGDGKIIGREMKFHLWFDPTQDFHQYAIMWTPNEIIFFVDDVPIRRYPRKSDSTFPLRPMWIYGSIWDASSWATEDGKYKADYSYQPFIGRYQNFKISGCTTNGSPTCRPPSTSPFGSGLSQQQYSTMEWVQRNYLAYDYCRDPKRDHTQTPEC
ncbi:probable xyloglucan endotransglucosylase/hydrolase protein 32 [Ricinus communis]|uniref:Xyloglucan endotransglucosylase/hydrolase n=1 Tax=Ricinus communis TaxID=3988 RepID=B9SCJ0_RICCO|nr:probable xyloglucan endotransglucosylase/hydrolase protein 32 [Ricinus communis]EEF38649.1 Xyloglucan endotransglucosylase/hydrolase protein 2 precursor, putative [Ricinus communis]|eukprot:XP_002523709.1 probable xyloglucan endotransglucosylase/hydrolase protein 32 [Ricinus communis]